MPTELYTVTAEDAPEMVSRLLERDDVRSIRVEDIDGEPLVTVPGTATPEAGAREVMDGWQEYLGGGSELHLVAETGLPPDVAAHATPEEPPEHPDEGEPRSHG